MTKYKCLMCGHIFTENQGVKNDVREMACPMCGTTGDGLLILENSVVSDEGAGFALENADNDSVFVQSRENEGMVSELEYPQDTARRDDNFRYMNEIHRVAVTGETIIDSMATRMPMPSWDDILILGAQLDPLPLDSDAEVVTETIIGKKAKQPLVINHPVFISHMSFGAISKEGKIALAKGSAMAKTAIGSGEGGILPEEMDEAYKYIFEYVPNRYSVSPENLRRADAIEIKIGQGTKPGMGGHLPGEKVTAEIARIRGVKQGEDIISPSKFAEVNSKEDLKLLVDQIREVSEGRPVGIKIAAGRIEKDMECCVYADPDFITIDGRGGATGASPQIVRDAAGIPTVYALHRARKYLNSVCSNIDLIVTGGLRTSADVAKALAMGAEGVACATAPLMAAACQQYRICSTGKCPVGLATQNKDLTSRLYPDIAAKRVANFFNVMLEELKTFARLTGHSNVHHLHIQDLVTISREISDYTDITHA